MTSVCVHPKQIEQKYNPGSLAKLIKGTHPFPFPFFQSSSKKNIHVQGHCEINNG